jgi:hypothetical protein
VFVFVMTPRSTNSQYCHDELSLAEDYKKPIVTVKYQHSEEMDPGLKLIIQRRQVSSRPCCTVSKVPGFSLCSGWTSVTIASLIAVVVNCWRP